MNRRTVSVVLASAAAGVAAVGDGRTGSIGAGRGQFFDHDDDCGR
jgi:hypothetical protein